MSDEQLEEMINEITKGQRFIKFQISQIKSGLECGLSIEQVQVYAKPKYNFLEIVLVCSASVILTSQAI